nr:protein Star-like [Cherax quadricarinatus]
MDVGASSSPSFLPSVCLSKFLEGPPLFNDEAMAAYLRKNYFLPPAASDYNLSGNDGASTFSASLLQFVTDYFKNKRGGVFVDIGAGDGEYHSLTLPLEKNLGWTGLLVEPNPRLYKKLLKKGRRAQVTKACVSPYSYPAMMKLTHPRVEAGTQDANLLTTLGMTKLSQLWHKDNNTQYEEFDSQCVPLENLVYAAGITSTIDLLVLDMSGTDLDVLMNTKFDVIPALEVRFSCPVNLVIVFTWGSCFGGEFIEKKHVRCPNMFEKCRKMLLKTK